MDEERARPSDTKPRFDLAPACALMALATLFGIAAVLAGQTASWDLRNYHLYDGWAWLNDRGARDLAPAQVQTFFNPLLYVPIYLAAVSMPPVAFSFVLGALQGLNALPLYAIARRLLDDERARHPRALALGAAIVGITGATQLGELGTTHGDNLVSLPFLVGVALLASSFPRARRRLAAVAGAGLALGIAVGLKLTLAPLALGIALAAPLLCAHGVERVRELAVLALGMGLGIAATAGPWFLHLWQQFGNPAYPLLSGLFPSEWNPPFSTRDGRWLVRDWADAIARPLSFLYDWRRTSEEKFRDLRIVALLIVVVAATPSLLRTTGSRALRFLLLAFAIGYALWLAVFGYYRYLCAWEMLAPAVVAAALVALGKAARERAAWVALALLAIATNPPDWGHVAHGRRFLEVRLPHGMSVDGALVLLAGNTPTAYLATALGADASYVRISGNLYGDPWPPYRIDEEVARRIDAHRGRVLLLHQRAASGSLQATLRRFGLQLDETTCGAIASNLTLPHEPEVQLCAVRRAQGARTALRGFRNAG